MNYDFAIEITDAELKAKHDALCADCDAIQKQIMKLQQQLTAKITEVKETIKEAVLADKTKGIISMTDSPIIKPGRMN